MDVVTLVDVVLGALVVEAIALYAIGRRSSTLPPFRTWIPTLAAGAFLTLALRSIAGSSRNERIVDLSTIGLLLALAGVAHACEVVQRVRAYRASRQGR